MLHIITEARLPQDYEQLPQALVIPITEEYLSLLEKRATQCQLVMFEAETVEWLDSHVIWQEYLPSALDDVLWNNGCAFAVDFDPQEFKMDEGVTADRVYLRYHVKDKSFSWLTYLSGEPAVEVDTAWYTLDELKVMVADPIDLKEWEAE